MEIDDENLNTNKKEELTKDTQIQPESNIDNCNSSFSKKSVLSEESTLIRYKLNRIIAFL